jgi:hypothetical protein
VDAGRLTSEDALPTVEVGSVPGDDPVGAAEAAVALHPWLPSLPEMPARGAGEGAVARGLEGFPFAAESPRPADGARFAVSLAAHDPALARAIDAARPGLPSAARAAALPPFLRALAARGAREAKASVLGPVALSRALVDPDGRPLAEVARTFSAVAGFVLRRALALARALREAGARPWIQVDEPGETDRLSTAAEAILGDLLARLRAEGVGVAVHDCGAVSGRGLARLLPGLALVDATRDPAPLVSSPAHLRALLDAGARVAWGVVPTDGRPPAPGRATAVLERAGEAAGDADLVRDRAALSPACGLGALSPEAAARVREALAREARRATDRGPPGLR